MPCLLAASSSGADKGGHVLPRGSTPLPPASRGGGLLGGLAAPGTAAVAFGSSSHMAGVEVECGGSGLAVAVA